MTIAVSADPKKASRLEIAQIRDDVDAINVMTYDYHGSWSERTGHNAPLYAPSDSQSPGGTVSVNATMQFWASQPIDREKVSIGLPFYGRSYAQVPATNDGLYQPFSSTPSGTYGSKGLYEYWDVNQRLNASGLTYEYGWDDETKVPYLYSDDEGVFVSFDNRRSIREKVEYAQREDWGGVMIWALSYDRNETVLTAVNRELTMRENGTTGVDPTTADTP